jgi:hypothetical protein
LLIAVIRITIFGGSVSVGMKVTKTGSYRVFKGYIVWIVVRGGSVHFFIYKTDI